MNRIKEKLRRALAMFLSLCVISPAFQGVALADILSMPDSSQTAGSEEEDQEGKIVIGLDGKRLLEEVTETVRLGDELRMEEWGMSFYYQDEEGNRHSYKTYEEIFGADSGSIYEISGDKIPFIDEEGISETLAENDAGLYVFVKLDDGTEPVATPGNGARRATASNGARRATSGNAEREPENSDASAEGMPEDDSQKETMQEEETEIQTATGNNAMQAASGDGIGQQTAADYGLTGREKLFFLFVNQSDRQLEFQIEIDGLKMKSVTVGRDSVLTREVPAAETELPDGEEVPEDGKDGNIQLATGSNAANGGGIGQVMEPAAAEEEEKLDGIQADSAQDEIITSEDSDSKKDDLYLEEGRVTEEDIPKEDIANKDIPNDHIPEENTAVSGEGSRDENSSEEAGESSTEDRKDKEDESKDFSLTEKESEESSKEKAEEIGEVFDGEESGGNEGNSDIEENHDSYEADPVLEEPESSHQEAEQEENESYIEEISEMSVSHHKAYRVGIPVEGDIDDGEFYGESDIEILFKDAAVYHAGTDGVDLPTIVYPTVILGNENEPVVMALWNEEGDGGESRESDTVALASVDVKDIKILDIPETDPLSGLTMNLYKYDPDMINSQILENADKYDPESYKDKFFMLLRNDKNGDYSYFNWNVLTGNSKRFDTGIHNAYIPATRRAIHITDGRGNAEGGVLHGIVSDEYEGERIVLEAPYDMGDFGSESLTGIAALFPKNEAEGGTQNEKNENGVTPFYNIKLGDNTIHYSNGRYTFCALTWDQLDSLRAWGVVDANEIGREIQPVHFNNIDTGEIFDIRETEPQEGRYHLSGGDGEIWNGGGGGFLPFGFDRKEAVSDAFKRRSNPDHFLFGMSFSFDFNLPSDGKIARREDMKFKFIGDDDVWVYLKDTESGDTHRLSLDLGGPHDAAYGDINFATGLITYNGVYDQEKSFGYSEKAYWYLYGEEDLIPFGDKWILEDSSGNKLIEKCVGFSRAPEGSSKRFSCDMYYLERGMLNANCFIDMNLSVIPKNEIKIKKVIQGRNDSQVSEHSKDKFPFKIVVSQDRDKLEKYREDGISDGDVKVIQREITGEGEISLPVEVYEKEYFYVEEILNDIESQKKPEETKWTAAARVNENAQSGNGMTTDIFEVDVEKEDGVIVTFTNIYGTPDPPPDPKKTIKIEKYVENETGQENVTDDWFTVELTEKIDNALPQKVLVTPKRTADTGIQTVTTKTYVIEEKNTSEYELVKMTIRDSDSSQEREISLSGGKGEVEISAGSAPIIKLYNKIKTDKGRIRVRKKVTGTSLTPENGKNFMIHLKSINPVDAEGNKSGAYVDTSVVLGNENGEEHWLSDWIEVSETTELELTETQLKEFTMRSVEIDGSSNPVKKLENGKYKLAVNPGDKFTIVVTNEYKPSSYFHDDAGVMNHFDKDKNPVKKAEGLPADSASRTVPMAIESRFLVTEQREEKTEQGEIPERLL